MSACYPHFAGRGNHKVRTWIGKVQPSDMSPEYLVKIRYELGKRPKIYVLSPALRDRDGERIPHIYPDNTLCTYLPRAKEWTSAHLIADVLVPWISDWLLFYEAWHATGEWLADAAHPTTGMSKE